jgi:hypothetical protein
MLQWQHLRFDRGAQNGYRTCGHGSVPETAPIHLSLHIVATLNVTAEEARRQVNRQVVTELGAGLIARDPELVLAGEQIAWRVPIVLSLPGLSDLGQVGTVDIDPRSGDLLGADVLWHHRLRGLAQRRGEPDAHLHDGRGVHRDVERERTGRDRHIGEPTATFSISYSCLRARDGRRRSSTTASGGCSGKARM